MGVPDRSRLPGAAPVPGGWGEEFCDRASSLQQGAYLLNEVPRLRMVGSRLLSRAFACDSVLLPNLLRLHPLLQYSS